MPTTDSYKRGTRTEYRFNTATQQWDVMVRERDYWTPSLVYSAHTTHEPSSKDASTRIVPYEDTWAEPYYPSHTDAQADGE